MPAQKKVENHGHFLREEWDRSPPREMWKDAGALWRSTTKNVGEYGWRKLRGGDGLILVANDTRNNPNAGGTNFEKVTDLTEVPVGSVFGVPMGAIWARAKNDWYDSTHAPRSAMIVDYSGPERNYLSTSQALHRAGGWKIWENGDGVSAKLDGTLDVTQNVIAFKNSQCFHRYEVGTVLRLAPNRGVGEAQAVPRAGTITLAKEFDATNSFETVEADISAAIPGALNTDYVMRDIDVGGERPSLFGLTKWIPTRESEAATTVFQVDRSISPGRLAGRRVLTEVGDGIIDVLNKMAIVAKNNGMPIDCIYVPLHRTTELNNLSESNTVHYRKAEATDYDAATLRFGMGSYEFHHPTLEKPWRIMADKDMADIEVEAERDLRVYGLCKKDINVVGRFPITWQVFTGEGRDIQMERQPATLAAYGGYVQVTVANQGHQLAASPSAWD